MGNTKGGPWPRILRAVRPRTASSRTPAPTPPPPTCRCGKETPVASMSELRHEGVHCESKEFPGIQDPAASHRGGALAPGVPGPKPLVLARTCPPLLAVRPVPPPRTSRVLGGARLQGSHQAVLGAALAPVRAALGLVIISGVAGCHQPLSVLYPELLVQRGCFVSLAPRCPCFS